MTTLMSPRRSRLPLAMAVSLSSLLLFLLLLLPANVEARRNSNSVRRQNGRPRRAQATEAAAPLPFLSMPGKDAILKPTFDDTKAETGGLHVSMPFFSGPSNKEVLQLFPPHTTTPAERLTLTQQQHLGPYEGAELVFHPRVAATTNEDAAFDEFQEDEDDGTGEAPYDGDDETTDGVLAMSLLGLVLWISLSALLVVRFIRMEKRREQLLTFWSAIDANPDLKHAVEQAAGGQPFPKFPRHAGLQRFLRATAVALAVTLGLNLVFFMSRAPVPSSAGGAEGKDDNGGGGGAGGGTEGGGGNLPVDPTGMGGDDGTGGDNPVLGVVVLFLLLASLVLIARGLYAACCTSSSPASSSSSSSSFSRGEQSAYPGGGGSSVGGSYEPVHPVTVTPYVSMHGNSSSNSSSSNSSSSSSPAQEVYYVGVPILPSSSNEQQQQQQEGEEGMEEGAPPPYSAAMVAAPASTAMVV